MINNEPDPLMIGFAIKWGHKKLQLILSDILGDGKIMLVGKKEGWGEDNDFSEAVAIPTIIVGSAAVAEITGEANKCSDGGVEVLLHASPQPNTEVIIR